MRIKVEYWIAVSLLLCIVSLASGVNAQAAQDTAGLINGHFWTSLTKEAKGAYLIGYFEVSTIFGQLPAPDASGPKEEEFFPRTLSFNETAKALDRFYDEPENLNIAVRYALHIIWMKVTGKPGDFVDRQTLLDRCGAAAILAGDPGKLEAAIKRCVDQASATRKP